MTSNAMLTGLVQKLASTSYSNARRRLLVPWRCLRTLGASIYRSRANRHRLGVMAFAALWLLSAVAHGNGGAAAGAPGTYRLQLSNDDKVCNAIQAVLNAQDKKVRVAAEAGITFPGWQPATGVDRDGFDGPVTETIIDLDNDGSPDRVLKAKFSMGGALTDVLHVASTNAGTSVSIRQILSSENSISFLDPNRLMERLKQKHGADWERWFFHGITTIEPLRYRNETYLLAQHVRKTRDLSSKAYVLQVGPARRINDACMFYRVCPCTGCRDLRGDEIARTLPSPQSCKAR